MMTEKKINNENKEIANYITTIVGVNRTVQRFWDEGKNNSLDVFTCDDPINPDVKFYGTIGLSSYPNEIKMKDNSQKNIPIEFLMTGYDSFDRVPNIISTSGFFLSKNKWKCQPGTVFKSVVEMYYQESEMKHILFTTPFLWMDKLQPLTLESKTVHWLLGIPISNSELNYKIENGYLGLEELFEKNEIDIFDLYRESVV